MSAIPMEYQTAYRWTGSAEAGEVTIEGPPTLPVGSPHSPERYSPEHLLVVAAETCLANYVLLIAGLSNLQIKGYQSTARGELEQEDKAGYRFKRIVIRPALAVDEGLESRARRVLEKSHKACLIARSLSCPVDMEASINGQPVEDPAR